MEPNKEFKFYIVGGFVRDKLLGLNPRDIDYAIVSTSDETNIDIVYERFCQYLLDNNYLIYLKKPECFTVKAKNIITNEVDDFVLTRKEIGYNSDSRKPIIVSGSIYDDLLRRDFTINAMAIDVETDEIIDPFNGRMHLKKRKLKTPLNPNITLLDDPLRVIRGLRFSITLDFDLTKEFMIAISNQEIWDKFKKVVSIERIRDELDKMFKVNSLKTLEILYNLKDINVNAYQIILNRIVLKPMVLPLILNTQISS